MQILLNGRPVETDKKTLDEFLAEQGYDGLVVATALDQHFVARDKRVSAMLDEGCQIEVVAPMQGG